METNKIMNTMSKVMSFDKIETNADVLKYALEVTQEDGKPNYDEACKMFEFFTSIVKLPDVKENSTQYILKALDKLNEMNALPKGTEV